MKHRILSLLFVCSLILSLMSVALAADSGNDKYLILGQDLSESQRTAVLNLLNVTDLSDYSVSYTTHQEEEDAFGSYMSSSVLGSKALSSILLVPAAEGSGISVTTYNISYCTCAMYQNALVDAGVKDVDVYVAGPTELSGTCALVSAMKAYSVMTGEQLDTSAADAAVNEIVTTGELGDLIGSNDDAAHLIAALKQAMLEANMDESTISSTLDTLCGDMGISVSETTKQEIISLMLKVKDTDLSASDVAEQAGSIYASAKDQLDSLGIDLSTPETQNLLKKLWDMVIAFFSRFSSQS